MASVLIPLPNRDFDPTEAAVPWRTLRAQGHQVTFATPDGKEAEADPRMVTGERLGILAPLLRADASGRGAYHEMTASAEFQNPIAYAAIVGRAYDALLLPGGHAPGMRPYLESAQLQQLTADFFAAQKPVAAICHGVLIAARARFSSGRSVLYGRKTTALTRNMEMTAWLMTRFYLGDYYRTYPVSVETEVRAALKSPGDFIAGPLPVRRDSDDRPDIGFTVRDGNYLSARWPGDAHRFGNEFGRMLGHRGQTAAA
jgi:protease I